jgi:PPOX class probable F420-dependent enzyme
MIPDSHRDLLSDERRAPAYLATLMPDGSPQLTPVWFSYRDGQVWINTRIGRVKERNLAARPQVALVIQDPDQRLRYLQIRGEVEGPIEEGGHAHIEQLSQKYDRKPFRELVPGEVRVIFKIKARSVSAGE